MYTHTSQYYDLIYQIKNYQEESDKIAALVSSLRPNVQTVLDVACGTAEHHRFFPMAWEMEGLDLDEGMLKVARVKFPDRLFHYADMADFQLSRQFDAVLCLFSSIGYLETNEQLNEAIRCFADHLAPGGILIVEPWFRKEQFREGMLHSLHAEDEGLKITRMSTTRREGRRSVLDFHYLIGEVGKGVRYAHEAHKVTMFEESDFGEAFAAQGLTWDYDPNGLTGRGLYKAWRD